jgi:hypothetical protein
MEADGMRHATVIANGDVECLCIHREFFSQYLGTLSVRPDVLCVRA